MANIEDILERHTEQDRENFAEVSKELKALREDVAAMRSEFSKYKGFVGGIAFVLGGLMTVIGFAIAWFK